MTEQLLDVDCSTEVWRGIPGYDGRYEVSTEGRIRATFASTTGRWKAGRILGQQARGNWAYRGVELPSLKNPGKRCNRLVHQLVLAAFVGPRPKDRWQVNHRDGCKTNNHICNLEYATPSENARHRSQVLGKGIGVQHSRAKLTEAQVLEMRERYGPVGERYQNAKHKRVSYEKLAQEYGLSDTTVRSIILRETWKHI